MKRVILAVILAAAVLFLFTGCGYDFLFGGELSVTVTTYGDPDLWNNRPTLHLKSGGTQIDEKMTASADGKSAWVTISHLKEADWDIWITLKGFPDWESAGTTVRVESRGLTYSEAAISLDNALLDLIWIISGDTAPEPAVWLEQDTSRISITEGYIFASGGYYEQRISMVLNGEFTELTGLTVFFPDGTFFSEGARTFAPLRLDVIDTNEIRVICSYYPGDGIYRASLKDSRGYTSFWEGDVRHYEFPGFGMQPVNPDNTNYWAGGDITFTVDGDLSSPAGYLVVHYIEQAPETSLVRWVIFDGNANQAQTPVNSPLFKDLIYIGLFDTPVADETAFTGAVAAALASVTDPEAFLLNLPEFSQRYLEPGKSSSYVNQTLFRIP